MSNKSIQDGDLLAYMEGEELPHVADALANSPELKVEFDQLKVIRKKLLSEFGGILRPDPQDLVDVVAGQATPTQRLLVSAYVRRSPQGQAELAALEAEWGQMAPDAAPTQGMWKLPEFLAQPLALVGVRSQQATGQDSQTYYTADIDVQITLQIPPPEDDRWQVQGYATHNDLPLTDTPISLQALDVLLAETDDMGFFTFTDLAAGHYDLRLELADSVVLIPNITLTDA